VSHIIGRFLSAWKMHLRRVHICDNIGIHGFAKKTQKTPPQEIALAVHRKEEYLTRRRKS